MYAMYLHVLYRKIIAASSLRNPLYTVILVLLRVNVWILNLITPRRILPATGL
jgi:hypothetical protein